VDTCSGTTWTVLGEDLGVVGPVERYLEFLRVSCYSHNTVKSYARALALWWTYLERRGTGWEDVRLADFGGFIQWLRRGSLECDDDGAVPLSARRPVGDSTVAARARAVMGFYRYHAASGVRAAGALYETVRAHPGPYLPFLEHVARRQGRRRARVKIRVPRSIAPVLSVSQIGALCDAEAVWDPEAATWVGDVRYRLLWSLLAEAGLRLGEALSLQHRDWRTSTGDTASVEIVPRSHPYGLVPKSGYRRVFIGSRLDRLYGDYVWALCELGADAALKDWGSAYVFCNTARQPLFAPLRPESVYRHLEVMKRRVPKLPAGMTPHWFRHTHATALLLSGRPAHVVSRRLGHRDVQTTLNTYGHVTEDEELRALADWREVTVRWGAGDDDE
jgi:site-specific recombinase XerD